MARPNGVHLPMKPDRNSQPQVSVPQEPCQSEAHSPMWDVTIYHPDGRTETKQVDFSEVIRLAASDNLKFTLAPAG